MPPKTPAPPITVSPSTASIAKGEIQQFTAFPSANQWTSSNVAVASVSATGKATGIAGGTATITAKSGRSKGTAKLTVTALVVIPPPETPPTGRGPQAGIGCPLTAVSIAAGSSIQAAVNANLAGTTFCLGAGIHYITSAITPKNGNTFIGQYGAIIDGSTWVTTDGTQGAFRAWNQDIPNVTIRNLGIRSMPQKGIATSAVGNPTWINGWIIEYCEIYACTREGIGVPHTAIVRNNIIRDNPYGGYQGYQVHGATFDNNEIARNGSEQKVVGCVNITFRNNWVHNNVNDGIWYDTDNTGSLIEDNISEDNGRWNIHYEISGQGTIRRNNSNRGQVGILIVMSKDVSIYENTLRDNYRGIIYYCKPAIVGQGGMPGGYDLANNLAYDNLIFVGTRVGSWACALDGDVNPLPVAYTNGSKNLHFTHDTYRAPNLSTKWWYWGPGVSKSWTDWNLIPQDVTGTFNLL